jgi:hypothetical protein
MQDNSIFSPKSSELNLELNNNHQLLNHFLETARSKVNQYFDNHFEQTKKEAISQGLTEDEAIQALKKAFQKSLDEAEKLAREKYAQKVSEKPAKQSPLA